MTSRADILDILLIAHNNGHISDAQLLWLDDEVRKNDFAQSNCPYKIYPPFNWENYDENTCQMELRFEKADILRLKRCLDIPDEIKFYKGSYCNGLEALCILLKRLAYPVRYCDMVRRFGRSVPDLCKITLWMLNYVYDRNSYLLRRWNTPFLRPESLQSYANAIHAKGAPLKNCFGFVDGTVRPICRPRKHQKAVYNGHKRVHSIKFQSVVIPNGLIANLAGPWGKFLKIYRSNDKALIVFRKIYTQHAYL